MGDQLLKNKQTNKKLHVHICSFSLVPDDHNVGLNTLWERSSVPMNFIGTHHFERNQ